MISAASVDVATANPVNMFIGRDRLGDNLGNSLLALDANTGKRIGHFQTVKHDIWDRDLPSPPSLITVSRDGKSVDAVLDNHEDRPRLRVRPRQRHAIISD